MQYRSCYEDTREVPNLNTNLKVKLMANSQCALSNQNIVEQLKETAKKNTWKLHRPQGLMVNYSLCEKLNKTPAEKMFFFAYIISRKIKQKTSSQNTGPCFSITLKTACKNSGDFEKKQFHLKSSLTCSMTFYKVLQLFSPVHFF